MSVYLVVEPIGIIASDLAASIQDFDGDADVVIAASINETKAALAGRDAVRVAFLHMSPDELSPGPLADLLADNSTVCVFMGEKAERRADTRFFLLERPFSTAMVADLLARIVPRDRARA